MRTGRELLTGALCVALAAHAGAEPAPVGGERGLFDAFELGSRKDPITVTADSLEYDYRRNVVVYHGQVQAAQGPVTLRSDTLTVTFKASGNGTGPANPGSREAQAQRVEQIVAAGNVRIEQGSRWATGGHAVFDQAARTLVLSESPVLHEGSNEVAGDRVVVYLDEDRSVVEGGRKRVKAVLYPGKEGGLAPQPREEPRAAAGAGRP